LTCDIGDADVSILIAVDDCAECGNELRAQVRDMILDDADILRRKTL
jgi:hypothetical protein